MKEHQPFWKKLCATSGWSVFTMFVWELIEEGLESLIAYAISSAFTFFVIKALSTLGIVVITQGIKVSIKRFLYPYIKTLTYKKGNDKMELLKKYWTKVWGNKITGTSVGVGFGLTAYFILQPIVNPFWVLALCVLGVFIVAYNLAIFFGGETLEQIQERLAKAKLNKEQQSIIKEAKQKIAQLEKEATQTEKQKAEKDAKEKAQKERDLKVAQAMQQLQAEAQKNAEAKK